MSAGAKKKRKKRKEVNPLALGDSCRLLLLVGAIWYVSRDSGRHGKRWPKLIDRWTIVPSLPHPPPPPHRRPRHRRGTTSARRGGNDCEQEPVAEDDEQPDEPSGAPFGFGPRSGSAGGAGPAIGGGGGGNRIGSAHEPRVSGSKFGWYAAKVQSIDSRCPRRNPPPGRATMSLSNPHLGGFQRKNHPRPTCGNLWQPCRRSSHPQQRAQWPSTSQGPPADMPMPINLRISARKPTSTDP
jgi:periplasmic protein TonB